VALDTGLENEPAQRLYESRGFERRDVRHAPDDRTARAIGGRGFVGYYKAL
jgi:ribosomal protein S18 acetylase RimI-like enzyme